MVVERAAILADGGDFPAIVDWITAHAGTPDTIVAANPTGYGSRLSDSRSRPSRASAIRAPTGRLTTPREIAGGVLGPSALGAVRSGSARRSLRPC